MKKIIRTDDTCWVIVSHAGKNRYEIYFIGPGEKPDPTGGTIIHYRRQPDTLTAMGYCMVLRQLSPASLREVARRENPNLTDLRRTLATGISIETDEILVHADDTAVETQ